MKILIAGGDGYLGWPTAMYLAVKGHEIVIADNLSKRLWENEVGAEPLMPVPMLSRRANTWNGLPGPKIRFKVGDLKNHRFVYDLMAEKFDAVVHYAEQPSAPYSMMGRENCVETQHNNVMGTLNLLFAIKKFCPPCHLVKLGTMGEYGTPNIDIEEGWIEVEHEGRKDRMLYPKKPGSFYHLSKVHDSHNIEFACRAWGLRATDLNQGVVYGIETEEMDRAPGLHTSFHYDAVFGTVINRFIVQAVAGFPLTVYGKGGQTRGFLNIKDTLQCVELALKTPAQPGEFRVFNQFTEQFSVRDLAAMVSRVATGVLCKTVEVGHYANPRKEEEEHYYNARHTALMDLGLKPHPLTDDVLAGMISRVAEHSAEIDRNVIAPRVQWDSQKRSVA